MTIQNWPPDIPENPLDNNNIPLTDHLYVNDRTDYLEDQIIELSPSRPAVPGWSNDHFNYPSLSLPEHEMVD